LNLLSKNSNEVGQPDTTQLFEGSRALWKLVLVALVPMVSIYCAGARPAWSLCVICFSMLACFIAVPPRSKVPVLIWAPLVVALLLVLAFAWPVTSVPGWRHELLRDFSISTGGLNSPQPWLSFERWLIIVVVCIWVLFCIGSNFSDSERRTIVQTSVLGMTAIAAIAIYSLVRWGEMPTPWMRDDGSRYMFGPFPNRNHFSGMCAITGMLAFVAAYDAIKRDRKSWILFSCCLAIAFAGLMLNTSRFGVVMFFVGCGLWMFSATFRNKSAKKMALFSSLFLFGATFLLIFGQKILQRFTHSGSLLESFTQSNRLILYRDSLRLIPDHPWVGWGLGNFEPIYALLGRYEDTFYRVSHPENDILWTALEIGLPATVLLLCALVVLFINSGPWRIANEKYGRRDRRIRQAAAIAALMFVAQSLVDVPIHSLGIAVLAGTLAGLGYDGQKLAPFAAKKLPIFHYTGMIFLLLAACLWSSVEYGKPFFPTDTFARKLRTQSKQYIKEGRNVEALDLTNKILKITPLDWKLYHQRAQLRLSLGYAPSIVLADFSRARRLEPSISVVSVGEAEIWAASPYPKFALAAYRDAINRDPNSAQSYYNAVLELGRKHPEFQRSVRDIALSHPKLHLQYTLACEGEAFVRELDSLLNREPELSVFRPEEQLQLFWHWYSKGNRADLFKRLNNKPQWLDVGWIVLATDQAQQGDFKEACAIAFEHLPPPFGTPLSSSKDLDQLGRLYLLNPTDIARGLQLYEAQKAAGKFSQALKTLDELASVPSSPVKIHYERALMLQKLGEFAKAWETLQQYLKGTKAS